jgi:hypothetical protein
MSSTTRVGFLAAAFALTMTGVGVAAPETTNNQNDRIATLEAKIASMEAAQNQNWLTEARADEIRGLVQDVLADADTRASLQGSGMTAGYDNGAVIGSADGNWLLRTNIHVQTRFVYNLQDDGDDGEGALDTNRYGFEPTRVKFILSGHVVNPQWYYMVSDNIGTHRSGLGNAYVGYDYGNGVKIQMGSMKAPLLHEELVEAQYQLAVERSTVNYLFTTGYTDGIQGSWEGDQFRVKAMLSDGANSNNTPWSTYDTEFALTGRVEWMAKGNWKQFDDFTSPQGGETGILVGAAAHYQQGEYGNTVDEVHSTTLTGDVSAEFNGFNLFGAIVWSDTEGADNNPWGLVLQGGWYFNESWELFGRFEFTDFDIDDVEDLSLLTIGVNKYFSSHNAKWTTDLGFAFDSVPTSNDLTGVRSDFDDTDGQVIFRTQWQILF